MNSNVWMELVMSVFIFLHLFFPSQIFFNPTYYHKGFVNFMSISEKMVETSSQQFPVNTFLDYAQRLPQPCTFRLDHTLCCNTLLYPSS